MHERVSVCVWCVCVSALVSEEQNAPPARSDSLIFLYRKSAEDWEAWVFLPGDDDGRLLTRPLQSAELVCSSERNKTSVTESRFCKQGIVLLFFSFMRATLE